MTAALAADPGRRTWCHARSCGLDQRGRVLLPSPRSVAEPRGGRASARPWPPGWRISETGGNDLHLRRVGPTASCAGRKKDVTGPRPRPPTFIGSLWTPPNLINSIQRSVIESKDVQTVTAEAPVWLDQVIGHHSPSAGGGMSARAGSLRVRPRPMLRKQPPPADAAATVPLGRCPLLPWNIHAP